MFIGLLCGVLGTLNALDVKVDMKQYPSVPGKTSVSSDGSVLKLTGANKERGISTTIKIPVRQYSQYVLSCEMRGSGITRTFSEWA